ncbi:SusC/RagA family TonB-linked outer membrane protein [Paraflavitalea pollutisoli]|uniref:SusC/RagA family TonB-linked outer membrane protein n=1 Tax=Paraflavitalea pollutisoli TaxID=3034143 RepID=UPI0023EC16F3|nr:SusC/RagA family TonB-linked outer membrane protein [Paraflavitalea sp. H1-2-19X]
MMTVFFLRTQATDLIRRQLPVAGTVTARSGEPLTGVSVMEKGKTNGTVTNTSGSFTLTVTGPDAVLVFSYAGYIPQEVKVGNRTSFTIQLEANNTEMGEVVVTAYGKVKKTSLTDAVYAVPVEKIANRPTRTVADGLVGLAPGLNIRVPSGAPESSPSINIRGFTSLNSTGSPLILIDGVERPLADVNPNDVESISLLKDGAATAIYGSRAPYGILLITTKSGKSGKMAVTYSTNVKIGKMVLFPTQPNSPDWARWINIAQRNGQPNGTGTDGVDAVTIKRMEAWLAKDWNNPVFDDLRAQFGDKAQSYIENGQFPTTDASFKNWTREQSFATNKLYDSYFNNSTVSQQHNLGFSGGNDKLQYFSSFGYNNTNGLLKGDFNYNKRFNLNTRLTYKANDWLELRTDLSYVRQQNQGTNYRAASGSDAQSGPISDYASIFGTMMQYFATPLRVPSGNAYSWILGASSILGEGGLNTNERNDIVLTGGATIRPLKHLELRADYTWRISDADYQRVDKIAYTELPNGTKIQNNRSANVSGISKNDVGSRYGLTRFSAQYQRSFGKHNLLAQAGMQAEEYQYKSLTGSRTDLFSQDIIQALNGAANNQLTNDNLYEWAVLGYYGVLAYDYAEKYMIKFAGRRDASSRFSPDSRWGSFPSVSVAWNAARENFWPLKDWITELKPRASWSTSGDVASSGSVYSYLPTLAFGVSQNTLLGGNYSNIATAPGLVSSTLTWAKPTVINLGFDLTALNRRFTLTYEWYQRTVKDQVGPPNPLPATLGTSAPSLNNSVSETRGWELSVGWNDHIKVGKKPLTYEIRFNMSDYIGYVTQYAENKTGTTGTWTRGELFGQNYVYDFAGIVQNKNDLNGKTLSGTYNYPGYITYKDLNGDGYINSGNGGYWYSRGDVITNGFNYPRKSYSILPSVSWNGITVSAVLDGVMQWTVYNGSEWVFGTRAGADLAYFYTPAFEESTKLGYWSPSTPNAFFPAFNTAYATPTNKYSLNLANLRVRNLTIGYDLPARWIERLKLKRVNIYASGDNLGFIYNKSYIKYDPELLANGVNGYPPLRYYSFGANINL